MLKLNVKVINVKAVSVKALNVLFVKAEGGPNGAPRLLVL